MIETGQASEAGRKNAARVPRYALVALCVLFLCVAWIGNSWGLPSRSIDPFLFGDNEPWPGEKIHRLAGAGEKLSESALRGRGADVDIDPLRGKSAEPTLLTGTDGDVAKILLRYRLYTFQPDEMITMMALSGMNPRKLQFDPRLYQYGGLFIYPVGAMIGAAGVLGLIDVRSDVVYYLDNPDEFGKFYIVARLYAALWGAVGVVVVFAIARRLTGDGRANPLPHGRGSDQPLERPRGLTLGTPRQKQASAARSGRGSDCRSTHVARSADWAGVLAAGLFAVMPVVVCMSHEGKPHLPGAVLMLIAVWFAMRHIDFRVADHILRAGVRVDSPGSRNVAMQPECSGDPSKSSDSSRGQTLDTARQGQAPAAQEAGSACAVDWWLMCVACGASVGMVLSSWPILVLIPLVAVVESRSRSRTGEHSQSTSAHRQSTIPDPLPHGRGSDFATARSSTFGRSRGLKPAAQDRRGSDQSIIVGRAVGRSIGGIAIAVGVYAITNPYVPINALSNRDVLASNFGNSFAMYEIARVGEGFLRVLELTVEGATLPVALLGLLALILALVHWRNVVPAVWVLVVPAAFFFLQFVLIGAGKPGEYGRFGIFTNTALAIGAAVLLNWPAKSNWVHRARLLLVIFVTGWAALGGWRYLRGFVGDSGVDGSRLQLAHKLADPTLREAAIGLAFDPAPYGCPAVAFPSRRVFLAPDAESFGRAIDGPGLFVRAVDRPSPNAGSPSRPTDHGGATKRLWHRLMIQPTPISWADKSFEVTYVPAAAGPD